ncbi:unnamed protein product, partial [Sphenostylis stenocarpa]
VYFLVNLLFLFRLVRWVKSVPAEWGCSMGYRLLLSNPEFESRWSRIKLVNPG